MIVSLFAAILGLLIMVGLPGTLFYFALSDLIKRHRDGQEISGLEYFLVAMLGGCVLIIAFLLIF